ncbi:MAG: type VI secretion system tube protein Hcp [Acidobacteriia bacterium]|nr:type VI secretion system tube protein Hcp [Terriglobia bacterium]
MATDYFLKLSGIKGEAQDAVYKDWIDIFSWSFGATQSGSGGHVGGGSGAGKVNMHDISVSKRTDTSSADLFLKCSNGKHYDEATIVSRKAGEKPLEFLKIKMQQVLVTSYQLGGSHGDDTPTESITLNFTKIFMDYQVQKPDGSGSPAGQMGWDVSANQKL